MVEVVTRIGRHAARHDWADERRAEVAGGRDPQQPRRLAPAEVEAARELIEGLLDASRGGQHLRAAGGEVDLPGGPIEQARPAALLELLDALADDALRELELLGGAGERGAADDRGEDAQQRAISGGQQRSRTASSCARTTSRTGPARSASSVKRRRYGEVLP
jgi:hypothetical protein